MWVFHSDFESTHKMPKSRLGISSCSSLLINLSFWLTLCACPVFLSQQIVPEDLRPVLSDQAQLQYNKRVHHRLDSPARAEPRSTSSRPAQVAQGRSHWETLFTHCTCMDSLVCWFQCTKGWLSNTCVINKADGH